MDDEFEVLGGLEHAAFDRARAGTRQVASSGPDQSLGLVNLLPDPVYITGPLRGLRLIDGMYGIPKRTPGDAQRVIVAAPARDCRHKKGCQPGPRP